MQALSQIRQIDYTVIFARDMAAIYSELLATNANAA